MSKSETGDGIFGTTLGSNRQLFHRAEPGGGEGNYTVFGSSNARYIKKLQPKIDASILGVKYQAMSDGDLKQQTTFYPRTVRSRGYRMTTFRGGLRRRAAKAAAASSACGTTMCS